MTVSELIENEYDIIEEPSTNEILELHHNHNFKKEESFKDKISAQITNLGFSLTSNGSQKVEFT